MHDPGGVADQMGWRVEVTHPLFEDHMRTTELVSLSRSGATLKPGEQIGGHTREILAELGYSESEMNVLRAANVVTWP